MSGGPWIVDVNEMLADFGRATDQQLTPTQAFYDSLEHLADAGLIRFLTPTVIELLFDPSGIGPNDFDDFDLWERRS